VDLGSREIAEQRTRPRVENAQPAELVAGERAGGGRHDHGGGGYPSTGLDLVAHAVPAHAELGELATAQHAVLCGRERPPRFVGSAHAWTLPANGWAC
jgi:hypothetical protein